MLATVIRMFMTFSTVSQSPGPQLSRQSLSAQMLGVMQLREGDGRKSRQSGKKSAGHTCAVQSMAFKIRCFQNTVHPKSNQTKTKQKTRLAGGLPVSDGLS